MPGGGILLWVGCDEVVEGEELLDDGGERDAAFAFAWGVLDVNRVASATLRGL